MTLLQVKTKVEGDCFSWYKAAEFLCRCLGSVLRSDVLDIEICIRVLYKLSVLSLGVVLFKLYF